MYIYSSYKLIIPDYPLIYLGILRKSIPQINNGSDNLDKWMMYGYASIYLNRAHHFFIMF